MHFLDDDVPCVVLGPLFVSIENDNMYKNTMDLFHIPIVDDAVNIYRLYMFVHSHIYTDPMCILNFDRTVVSNRLQMLAQLPECMYYLNSKRFDFGMLKSKETEKNLVGVSRKKYVLLNGN